MRVIAIESFKDGVMRSYGEGEYLGQKIPDTDPFNKLQIKNPCIKLDSDKYVWGFQCWWGSVENFRKSLVGRIEKEIIVEIDGEILPVS